MQNYIPTPRELAAQLRKPEGELGIDVANNLNETNVYSTRFVYELMQLQPGYKVLELGFGNGKLMPLMFERSNDIHITGVDFSETMVQEAQKSLMSYIAEGKIAVSRAEVSRLPFPDNSFDRICSINTLYFWPHPLSDARELLRVLKPGSSLFLGIRPKDEAEKLATTKYGFKLYHPQEAADLLSEAGFKKASFSSRPDPEITFNGARFKLSSVCVVGTKPLD